jgi:YD repeat-containing protein
MRPIGGGSGRWPGRILACCVAGAVGLLVWVGFSGAVGGSGASAVAVADTAASGGSTGSSQNLPLDSLAMPGVEAIGGGELAREQRRARLLNPEAVAARARSRTEFEHLGVAAAIRVAREAFQEAVEQPAGGAPSLPAGEHIVRYDAKNAAAISLPGGKHGVIESLGPIATPAGHGRFTPINLALHPTGSGYAPANSDVAVQIPKHASSGVSMPSDGVSLTPVNAQGQPLGGSEGVREGASVLYANTQTDTDTLAKPTTGGFEIDSLLRSVDSPETLYFKVGLPAGASLVKDNEPGGVRVVRGRNQTIANIAVPSAQDAAGTEVPLTMREAGDILVVTVRHSASDYEYPIAVDPRAYDTIQLTPNCTNYVGEDTNWEFSYVGGSFECYLGGTPSGFNADTVGSINAGEYDELRYPAHGQAGVAYIEGELVIASSERSKAETRVEFIHKSGGEKATLEQGYTAANPGESHTWTPYWACDESVIEEGASHCRPYNYGNELRIMQTDLATEGAPEGYGFWFALSTSTWVSIYQEKHPEVSFNTSEETISAASGHKNVLYHGHGWLGEDNGAFEVTAKDQGLGISGIKVRDLTAGSHGEHWEFNDPVYAEHKCAGVWCGETFKTNSANGVYFTYNKEMAEGENTFELCAEDEAAMESCTKETIDVDNTPPREIKLSGLLETGAEISATQHQITVEATDGTKPTPSSGVKSIIVSVDGRDIAGPSASCPSGECTAHGTWTIDGESLGAGEHKLEIFAIDNANDVSSTKVVTFAIRNATPVKLGPGTVDPVTGQFKLSANDVTMAGAGSVSRSYVSRSPGENLESPLGPQWKLNAGDGQSLKLLPDGSAELQGSGNESTIFAYKEGKFQAPKGDENLALEPKEESGKAEYVLRDSTAGAVTIFTRPLESQFTVPTFTTDVSSFGSGSGDTGSVDMAVAVGPDGNVWVADNANARVDEFSGNGAFVKAFGYGVRNGASELQTCTTSCRAGVPGGGPGQFSWSGGDGIAVGSNGDIWVSSIPQNGENNRLGEFNEEGKFLGEVDGGEGEASGAGEMDDPTGVTVDAKGDVWVSDYGNARVDEFNEKREFVKAFGFGVLDGAGKLEVCTTTCKKGLAGKESGELSEPFGIATRSGYIWVADIGDSRIDKFTESGGYIGSFGTEGTGNGQFHILTFISIDSRGDIWASDLPSNYQGRLQEFNEKGEYLSQLATTELDSSGTSGDGFVGGTAVGSNGSLWITNGNQLQEWTHSIWVPTKTEAPAPGDDREESYRSVIVQGQGVTEPIEELGPVPAGVSCGKNPAEVSQAELGARLAELKAGCRALSFTYAEKTTATGEGPSVWGEYAGRLMKVSLTAYNPAKGVEKMETKAVAEYIYDGRGKLRAEWDPRISPALKITYGYDSEGHVTAQTPPGLESWAFTYGTIAGDSDTGRLLSVTRPSASTAREPVSAPVNTVAPALSNASPVGNLSVTAGHGTWSNNPLSYAYQWEDCNGSGKECAPILGATNETYVPTKSDVEHSLVVQVSAMNANGTVTAVSAASAVVPRGTGYLGYEFSFGNTGNSEEQVKDPVAVAASLSPGEVYVSSYGTNRVEKFNQKGEFLGWVGTSGTGAGDIEQAESLAVNGTGKVWVGDTGNHRIDEFNTKDEFVKDFGASGKGKGQFGGPIGGLAEAGGIISALDTADDRIENFSTAGAFESERGSEGGGEEKFRSPEGIAMLTSGGQVNTYVVDSGNYRVQHFKTLGEEIFGKQGIGNDEFEDPTGVALEESGTQVYVSDAKEDRVQTLRPNGEFIQSIGSPGSAPTQFNAPRGLADAGNTLYVADSGNNRIDVWGDVVSSIEPVPPAPKVNTNSVWTVEYRVPLSGSSAPYQMTSTELAKWGQKEDLPEEATAIFPPDEPQGWPAADYKRATVLYMDGHARTTNTASPSGAISTVEYNSLNEVTRTLSAADRAVALKEGSKSAEVAKVLSSERIYNGEGTQLLETYGPEHKVKLPSGSEEETRDRQEFSYNEGEPSKGEKYNLATKEKSWVEGALHKELEPHEKTLSYSDNAMGELGWTLRKPIVVTEKINKNQTSTETTQYSPETGDTLETAANVSSGAPVSAFQFGSSGSGNGQFNHPGGVAVDGSGNVWVADGGNNRIQKFSSSGVFIGSYGSKGTGGGQFEGAVGIAVNKTTGNVYATDPNNNRVQEFSSSGTFVRTFGFGVSNGEAKFEICTSSCRAGTAGSGAGQVHIPTGITVDPSGNVWVVDGENDRVEEFKENGEYLSQFGSKGTGSGQLTAPEGVTISDGEVYVTDTGNDRVEAFSPTGKYLSQWGSKGSGSGQFNIPLGIATDPVSGALFVADRENSRVEEFSRTGTFLTEFGSYGTGEGHIWGAADVAVTPAGSLYVADEYNNRVDEWEPVPSAPIYTSQFGNAGSETEKLEWPSASVFDSHGNMWVVDVGNDRVVKLTPEGKYSAAYGSSGSGAGQFSKPSGIAVNQSTGNMYIGDTGNNRVEELNSEGKFVSAFGFGVSNGKAELQTCTSTCMAGTAGSGNGQFSNATGVAIDGSGNVWVADTGNNRIEKFSSSGAFIAAYGSKGSEPGQFDEPFYLAYSSWNGAVYVADCSNGRVQEISTSGVFIHQFGEWGKGNGQFDYPYGIGIDPNSGNVYVGDPGDGRIEQFTPAGAYLTQFATKGSGNGQIKEAEGIAISNSGVIDVVDSANFRVEQWTPAPRPGNEGAKDTKTTYYSAAANTEYPNCGKHPEWANLVCQTEPVARPGDSGPPTLPVTVTTYNIWGEIETVVETIGTIRRTSTTKYDNAGREVENNETAIITKEGKEEEDKEDGAVPAVTDEYNSETGSMVKIKDTLEGKEKAITSIYDTLGRLVSGTDAEGDTTKYSYDIDGRIAEVSEPKGSQIYAYNATTGFTEKLQDNGPEGTKGAGMFTATYGVLGEMLTEGYPNGMTAKYTYNPIGQTTNLEYEKTTHCGEKCVWFSDAESFGSGGELMSQASSLSKETYSYNEAGQLAQTKEESPNGASCIEERAYGYNENTGERLSVEARKANEKGECTKEGGVVEGHAYDVVGRLLDSGVSYDLLGNMTKVPALDAGGQAITSSFYVDNQVATQEQDEKTIAYTYDPAGRTMIAKLKTKTGTTRTIDHYAGPGEGLAWTCEEEEGKKECEEGKESKWTRDVRGIDGTLTAIQVNGGAPVLQLHDLQGNVVATAADNETETKLLSTQNSSEFGVSPTGKTPKYARLGAEGAQSELETGVITQSGATYVPQLARMLQGEEVAPPGAAPGGEMQTEAYHPSELPWAAQSGAEAAAEAIARQRTKEREAQEALERAEAKKAAEEAAPSGGTGGSGGGEESEAPVEGTNELEGSCTAKGACAASTIKCSLAHDISPTGARELGVAGEAYCTKSVEKIQTEVCIYEEQEGELLLYNECTLGTRYKTNKEYVLKGIPCTPHTNYEGWVWGWAYSGGRSYKIGGVFTGPARCLGGIPGNLAELLQDMSEFGLEQFVSGGAGIGGDG